MSHAVIAATGLFTPEQSISNAELVTAYNAWAEQWNADHAAEILEGDLAALTPSSEAFIEKASGIKSRFVLDKAGIIDPRRMAPNIPERSNDELSIMAEMAVAAARQAIAAWGKPVSEIGAVLCAASNMQRPYPAMAIEVPTIAMTSTVRVSSVHSRASKANGNTAQTLISTARLRLFATRSPRAFHRGASWITYVRLVTTPAISDRLTRSSTRLVSSVRNGTERQPGRTLTRKSSTVFTTAATV